jgi:phosphonate C-P lyase system protein PhnG
MRACADASLKELSDALDELAPLPAVDVIRVPEIGLVMLRGRVGGNGSPFNVGEATVARGRQAGQRRGRLLLSARPLPRAGEAGRHH